MVPDFVQDAIARVVPLSLLAGEEILKYYESEYKIQIKEDKSPLTEADLASQHIICRGLETIQGPAGRPLPVLGEESSSVDYQNRKDWEFFWLVDPLDGTKEFISRNGEFTTNIALIHNRKPVGGVIGIPIQRMIYFAVLGCGAYRLDASNCETTSLEGRSFEDLTGRSVALTGKCEREREYTIIGSRSHGTPEYQELVSELKAKYPNAQVISSGSALKFCRVAEGEADIYPRLGPTMEWDTGAGHALVNTVGKRAIVYGKNEELSYNKDNLLNPWFVVQ